MLRRIWIISLAALVAGTQGSVAQDKSKYSLFDPTPDRFLRDMTTDRPDTTESPFTIDAGRVQVETNVFGYALSRPDVDGSVTDSFEIATTNIRVGLTHNTELNIVWQPHGVVDTRSLGIGGRVRESGVGGLDLRGKINFWGNDTFESVGSAMALLPFVTLPTDEDNGIGPADIEAGFIVPLALTLPSNAELGVNGGVVWVKGDDSSYRPEYLATAALAYEWNEYLGTYYEIAATFNTGDPRSDTAVVLGTGVTYALSDNLQLDAGINFGVTESADRINPFVGVSQRF
jgi:hypothetical protein